MVNKKDVECYDRTTKAGQKYTTCVNKKTGKQLRKTDTKKPAVEKPPVKKKVTRKIKLVPKTPPVKKELPDDVLKMISQYSKPTGKQMVSKWKKPQYDAFIDSLFDDDSIAEFIQEELFDRFGDSLLDRNGDLNDNKFMRAQNKMNKEYTKDIKVFIKKNIKEIDGKTKKQIKEYIKKEYFDFR